MSEAFDPGPAHPALARIHALLRGEGVAFREVTHPPTRTSEESARARGEPLEIGGKALLLKVGDALRLFVLSAPLKLDSAAVKQRFGVKKLRFATADELAAETEGLVPGCVPPFGPPVLPFELFVDESIAGNERIAFNAAMLTVSIVLAVPDYLRVARPVDVFRFGAPAT